MLAAGLQPDTVKALADSQGEKSAQVINLVFCHCSIQPLLVAPAK